MPGALVVSALRDLANTSGPGAFGGPLNYKGYQYGLDLSQLPTPPGYYRLPGGSMNLLDLVQTICEDSGCDFFVELVGLTIVVRVVSRFFQPPLGTITALAAGATFSGQAVRTEAGVEARNETTSVLLTGGEKTGVYITSSLLSYWGTDVLGNPVVGTAGTLSPFGTVEFANLNAADCADIVGSTTYQCSTIEMRFALWGVEMWAAFVNKFKPDIGTLIGDTLYGDNGIPFPGGAQPDMIKDAPEVVNQNVSDVLADRRSRLYDLVRRYAEDFYGKQFLVQIPDIAANIDPETGIITSSMEVSQAGYLEFGAASLGVPETRLDVLQQEDDRVVAFAYYQNVVGADTSRMNWGETAVDANGQLWCRVQASSRILFLPNNTTPYVHVRLGAPLYDINADQFGDITVLKNIFGPNIDETAIQNVNTSLTGTVGYCGVHQAARYPAAIGVPLKSNVEVYGPWFIAGTPGRVRVEQDPSLTPWDYGSADVMNLAGQARVQTTVTNQTVQESGGIVVAGAPSWSLGNTMTTGGPNLTNLEVQFGPQGVTTSYRFQTFTPRFGLFARQNVERIRRLALSAVEQRRQIRRALNRALIAASTFDRAARGAKANKEFWNKKQSPHTVLMAQSIANGDDTRAFSGTETYETSLSLLNQGGSFTDRAIMSLSGLVRGFSTNRSGGTKLAYYPQVVGSSCPITQTTLDPFQAGNDVEVLAWGQSYSGAHAYRRGATAGDTRALALRGPLVVAGWGWGIDGKPVPGDGNGGFASNYLRRSDLWPAGPLEVFWDKWRGVWTGQALLSAVNVGDVGAGGTGWVNVVGYTAQSPGHVQVFNQWSSTIKAGKKCLISWVGNEGRFQFVAVDC
jgi:hypothetical protein